VKALILAAGKGTRLKQLTVDKPKPMLEIGGEPLLAPPCAPIGCRRRARDRHQSSSCRRCDLQLLWDGQGYGCALNTRMSRSCWAQRVQRKKLASFLDEPFYVIYGDVFNNVALRALADFHTSRRLAHRASAALTMSLYRVPNPSECGLVEVLEDGRVTRFVEKPPPEEVFTDLANAGLLVCDAEILGYVPAGTGL
jgi:NDP-sugar pyrophosphorylase family protein